ncbi:MAG: hypothetical protein WBF17_10875, partial [Phycisphaerae bacterium]
AIAEKLDVPIFEIGGQPYFALPVHCSEMNTIVRLDLSGLWISDLSGIQYATNLAVLDLSDNLLRGDLDPVRPRAAGPDEPDAGAQVGLSRLRYLVLDRTNIWTDDLTDIELIAGLRFLSASGNELRSTDALGRMREMRRLDLSGNELESILALAEMSKLEIALLQSNWLTDIGPLVSAAVLDDGDFNAGYEESSRWYRTQYEVPTVLGGDYRYMAGGESATATWAFENVPDGTYDVYVSWHGHQGQASVAPYTVYCFDGNVQVSANQRFAPDDEMFAGIAFESLGQWAPEQDGTIRVVLDAAGADGTVVADAVLLVSTESPAESLRVLNLHGNPLSDYSNDIYIPLLTASGPKSLAVAFDPNNDSPEWTQRIEPQEFDAGGYVSEWIFGLDSMVQDMGWTMMVGMGGSAEVLRFTSPNEVDPDAFVRVGASAKAMGLTGRSIVTGIALSPAGMMYLVDSASRRAVRVDPFTGRWGAYVPLPGSGLGDVVFGRNNRVQLTDTINHQLLRRWPDNLGDAGSRPLNDSAINYRIALGDGNDLYIGNVDVYSQDTVELIDVWDDITPPIPIIGGGLGDGALQDLAYADEVVYVLMREYVAQTYELRLKAFRKYPNDVYVLEGETNFDGWIAADGEPSYVEVGPDGMVYVSNGDTGEIRRVDPATLGNPEASHEQVLAPGEHMEYGGPIAFQSGFDYELISENPGQMTGNFSGGALWYGTFFPGYQGTTALTVRAYDHLGRSSDMTFNVHVGVGAVYGWKYDDPNGDGVRQSGEQGLENWKIYDDLNNSEGYEPGEPFTLTDANGSYALFDLAFGTHTIAEVVQDYAIQTNWTAQVNLGEVEVYGSDFEADWGGFTYNNSHLPDIGLWHYTDGRRLDGDPNHSPDHSFYYGVKEGPYGNGNYDEGDTGGYLAMPMTFLPGGVEEITLRFNYFLQTERSAPSADLAEIMVRGNTPIWWTTASNVPGGGLNDPTSGWDTCSIDITSFGGQIFGARWVFDSINDWHNFFEGWYVDDVSITAKYDSIARNVNFNNQQVIDAGPDVQVDEGDLVQTTASNIIDYAVYPLEIRGGTTSSNPEGFIEYRGDLYFAADHADFGRELYVFDGTDINLVQNYHPAGSSDPHNFAVYDGKLFFAADDGSGIGVELHQYDGSTITLAADINDWGDSWPELLTVYNDGKGEKLYMSANDGPHGHELMVYDGTSASLVTDLNAFDMDSAAIQSMCVFDGMLYFSATDGGADYADELYKYDGVEVSIAADLVPGWMYGSFPDDLTVFRGELYFAATVDNGIGRELYRFDGKNAYLVADIWGEEGAGSSPDDLTVLRNLLFFSAEDDRIGRELFYTDGVDVDYYNIARDSYEPASSNPSELGVMGDSLYFQATNNEWDYDYELWRLDLSQPHPQPVMIEINIESSSSPAEFTPFNDRLYFAAHTWETGREMFCFAPDPSTYSWSVTADNGESIPGGSQATFSFVPGNSGVYHVDLTVDIEGYGWTFSDSFDAFVGDVSPTIDAGGDAGIGEG